MEQMDLLSREIFGVSIMYVAWCTGVGMVRITPCPLYDRIRSGIREAIAKARKKAGKEAEG